MPRNAIFFVLSVEISTSALAVFSDKLNNKKRDVIIATTHNLYGVFINEEKSD